MIENSTCHISKFSSRLLEVHMINWAAGERKIKPALLSTLYPQAIINVASER